MFKGVNLDYKGNQPSVCPVLFGPDVGFVSIDAAEDLIKTNFRLETSRLKNLCIWLKKRSPETSFGSQTKYDSFDLIISNTLYILFSRYTKDDLSNPISNPDLKNNFVVERTQKALPQILTAIFDFKHYFWSLFLVKFCLALPQILT